MENALSPEEKQRLISSFLEIAIGQTADIAAQFLEATTWKLEEALQLFYAGNEVGAVASSSLPPPVNESPSERENVVVNENVGQGDGDDEVRAPLPVKRDTLYGDASVIRLHPSSVVAFRNFEEESKRPAVWESDQKAASTANGSRDNLASLYRPPFALMYQGPFDKEVVLLVFIIEWWSSDWSTSKEDLRDKIQEAVASNVVLELQQILTVVQFAEKIVTKALPHHLPKLNRDTWANEAVAQTIRTNFIFWQMYHDASEGKKVCTYYNLVSIPAILVIDPITGQKMRAWSGMVQPERLLEDLLPYLDKGPKEHHAILPQKRPREMVRDSTAHTSGMPDKTLVPKSADAVQKTSATLEDAGCPIRSHATDDDPKHEKVAETSSSGKPIYPLLPEEPKGSRELLCRVGIRLPDGRRLQRNFLRKDPVKFLWSFCCSKLEDGGTRPFHFTQAIPGASKVLNYESNLTFEEAGLSNSMISLAWD
ncbi:Plant UBX domain-containing protein 7 [Cocos nucifera]|uniref:Plant UBX domain-containing protein 7 n=1 Tax=Cocos nucifera TaxID=13894 RepID=A0A8K0IJL2_COCNU|nr:Plant UBX domain-containing protein 7 [Cocos nucifera]